MHLRHLNVPAFVLMVLITLILAGADTFLAVIINGYNQRFMADDKLIDGHFHVIGIMFALVLAIFAGQASSKLNKMISAVRRKDKETFLDLASARVGKTIKVGMICGVVGLSILMHLQHASDIVALAISHFIVIALAVFLVMTIDDLDDPTRGVVSIHHIPKAWLVELRKPEYCFAPNAICPEYSKEGNEVDEEDDDVDVHTA